MRKIEEVENWRWRGATDGEEALGWEEEKALKNSELQFGYSF